ncbi:MAG TPA: hypothetical protein VIO16_03435 [Dehalococcoidia bacterium]|jgi:ribosomal protein L37AE/L43A
MTDHLIDPHHTATGEWFCYECRRPLAGSYLRPVVPWQHRPEKPTAKDETVVAGLETTE